MNRVSFKHVFPTIIRTAVVITAILILYGLARAVFSTTEPGSDVADTFTENGASHKDMAVFHGVGTPEADEAGSPSANNDTDYQILEADMHKPESESLYKRRQLGTRDRTQPLELTSAADGKADVYENICISKIGSVIFLKSHPFTFHEIKGLFNKEGNTGYLLQPASLHPIQTASFASDAALKDFMKAKESAGTVYDGCIELESSQMVRITARLNSASSIEAFPELVKALLELDYTKLESLVGDPQQLSLFVCAAEGSKTPVELGNKASQIAAEQQLSIAKFLQPNAVIAASGRIKMSDAVISAEMIKYFFRERSLLVESYLIRNVFCWLGKHAYFVHWTTDGTFPSYSKFNTEHYMEELFVSQKSFDSAMIDRNAPESVTVTEVKFHGKWFRVMVCGLPLSFPDPIAFARNIVEEVACGQFVDFARAVAPQLSVSTITCLIIPK